MEGWKWGGDGDGDGYIVVEEWSNSLAYIIYLEEKDD